MTGPTKPSRDPFASSPSSSSMLDPPPPVQPTPRRGPPAHLSLGPQYPLLPPIPPPTPSSSVSGSVGRESTSTAALLQQHQLQLIQRGPLTPAPSPASASRRRFWDEDRQNNATGYGYIEVPRRDREGNGSDPGTSSTGTGMGGDRVLGLEMGFRDLWRDTGEGVTPAMGTDAQMLIEHFQTLEPAQRFAFLALLVPSMRMDEALNLSRKIEPRLKRDFLRELPGELALHCLSFISDAHTLIQAAKVSKYWYGLLQDEQTWKDMCEWHHFTPISTPLRNRRKAKEKYRSPDPQTQTSAALSSATPLHASTGASGSKVGSRQWLRDSFAGGLGIRGLDLGGVPDASGTALTPPSRMSSATRRRGDATTASRSSSTSNHRGASVASLSGTTQRQQHRSQRQDRSRWPGEHSDSPDSPPEYYVPSSLPLGPHPALRPKGPEGYSFKAHFKDSYLTQRNWVTGGRVLKEFIAVNEADGVVTSLAVNEHYLIIGMANDRIHVFEAATARYRGTLVGHSQGVWTLTLISPYAGSGAGSDSSDEEDECLDNANRRSRPDPKSRSRHTGSGSASPSTRRQYPHQHRPGRQSYRDDGISRRASTGTGQGVSDFGTPPTDARMRMGPGPVGESVRTYHPPSLGHTLDSPTPVPGVPGVSSGPIMGGVNMHRPSTASGASTTRHHADHDDPFGVPAPGSSQGQGRRPRLGKKKRTSDVCGSARGWTDLGTRHLIVSGGCDKMVKVWDVGTGVCVHTLAGHSSTVRCLKVLDRRPIAISGSRDAKLRVWDINQGVLLRELEGHTGSVRCIEIAGNLVVSGSYDNTARVWNVDTGECLHVLRGHYHQIYSCAFDGERIITGSLDSTVRVWDAVTGECIALLQGHTSLVGHTQFRGNRLVTGGSDGRLIIFDLSTYECLHRLCAHDNSITSLQFDERFIVSGGMDGRVKLWDTRTGTFIRELTRPGDAVWRIGCRDDRVIILCQRAGRTVLEVLTFKPGDMVGKRLAL